MTRSKKSKRPSKKSILRRPGWLAIVLLVCAAAVASAYLAWFLYGQPEAAGPHGKQTAEANDNPGQTEGHPAILPFNKNQYSLSDSGSLWVIVNKGRRLPEGYTPGMLVTTAMPLSRSGILLREDAAKALESLVGGAKSAGLNLMLASGYRSYSYQTNLYNGYVSSQGQTEADRTSARPGHSEHQTGLAADLAPVSRKCEIEKCFGNLAEGKWLASNAHSYGFIIRYPEGQESFTGYDYEPWHIRYVGAPLAGQIYNSGETLEQFFGLPTYPSYPSDIFQLAV